MRRGGHKELAVKRGSEDSPLLLVGGGVEGERVENLEIDLMPKVAVHLLYRGESRGQRST